MSQKERWFLPKELQELKEHDVSIWILKFLIRFWRSGSGKHSECPGKTTCILQSREINSLNMKQPGTSVKTLQDQCSVSRQYALSKIRGRLLHLAFAIVSKESQHLLVSPGH